MGVCSFESLQRRYGATDLQTADLEIFAQPWRRSAAHSAVQSLAVVELPPFLDNRSGRPQIPEPFAVQAFTCRQRSGGIPERKGRSHKLYTSCPLGASHHYSSATCEHFVTDCRPKGKSRPHAISAIPKRSGSADRKLTAPSGRRSTRRSPPHPRSTSNRDRACADQVRRRCQQRWWSRAGRFVFTVYATCRACRRS